MFTKYYEKIYSFMKENLQILLFYLVLIATLTYPLPFYIYTGGGLIDTENRVEIEGEEQTEGSLHFLYVSQRNATIPTYLLSFLIPTWDLESISSYQITEEEEREEIQIRDRLYLEEANTAAIFVAYQKASKHIQVHEVKNHVIYILDKSKTNLKIGDVVLSVEGEKIEDIEDVKTLVRKHSVGDRLRIQVLRNQKEIECFSEIYEANQEKYLGISLLKTYDYDLDPSLALKFKSNESGPSGGLMLALTIYNKLVSEDVTGGLKIAGTGTIDQEGNVGTIGGVKYKLRGAVEAKVDLMLVPSGENYEECLRIKEQEHLDIELVSVSTFDEALRALENFSHS